MKIIFTTIISISFVLQTFGQTSVQTKEIKIPYTNGYIEVFRICVSNCQTTFDDNKEYFWYTEFSNIKSTKGGSGGNLLHGNYKLYNNGNLSEDKNYYLGLPDGSEKTWDSIGNITSQIKYSKGDIIYWKFKNDEGLWIEHICVNGEKGFMMSKGWIKKVYSEYNQLLSEETMLAFDSSHVKTYFDSGKLQTEYTSYGGGQCMAGKYTSYYENGKIKTAGQFYKGKSYLTIAVGTWKFYKSDGTLEGTLQYKENIELWDNGNKKVVGGYILGKDNTMWLKTGEWRWYDEEGKFQSKKNYENGVETNE